MSVDLSVLVLRFSDDRRLELVDGPSFPDSISGSNSEESADRSNEQLLPFGKRLRIPDHKPLRPDLGASLWEF